MGVVNINYFKPRPPNVCALIAYVVSMLAVSKECHQFFLSFQLLKLLIYAKDT